MKLEFHPEALAEYEAAVMFYEGERDGLGDRFAAAVGGALDSVRESPSRWPVLEASVRRRLTRVFPYAVLYSIEADCILVVAIMHCHREPGYWRERSLRQ